MVALYSVSKSGVSAYEPWVSHLSPSADNSWQALSSIASNIIINLTTRQAALPPRCTSGLWLSSQWAHANDNIGFEEVPLPGANLEPIGRCVR